MCNEGFVWNPSNCECEYDKSCDGGEQLDYKNCKCRKRLADKLVQECNENIDERKLHPRELHSNKMIYNSTLNDYKKICSSCIVCIILFVIFFIISIAISSVFIYFHWYLKRKYTETKTYWMQLCWTCKWEMLSKLILKIVGITLMTWSILKTLIQT